MSGSGGGSENGERSSGVEPDEQERAWIESFEKWDEAWYALAVVSVLVVLARIEEVVDCVKGGQSCSARSQEECPSGQRQ